MGDDRVGLGEALEVLAEPRVDRRDPGRLQRLGGGQRIVHRLAGHEPPDGPAHEPEPRQMVLQPSIPGGPQEDPAHASPPSPRRGVDVPSRRWYATSAARIAGP